MKTKAQREWQAEKYHENSGVQHEAATHLLKVLNLKGTEEVLDVGCGDGKITAAIATALTKGAVLGTDLSEEMIHFASHKFLPSEKNNLKFSILSAEAIDFSNQFDVVFSSFALQWVLKIETFFQKAHQSLKPNGRIACTIPLSISDVLEESLAILLKDPEWSSYFEGFTLNFYLRDENIYDQILSQNGFTKIHFEVVDQEWIFPSREDLEQYIFMWLPHLNFIPQHLQERFFKQLMDKYVELNPVFDDGRLSFLFDRVDFIVQKKL